MAMEDPAPLEEEMRSNFTVVVSDGAYIYHSDHSVPANVSIANYCRVTELVGKYGCY